MLGMDTKTEFEKYIERYPYHWLSGKKHVLFRRTPKSLCVPAPEFLWPASKDLKMKVSNLVREHAASSIGRKNHSERDEQMSWVFFLLRKYVDDKPILLKIELVSVDVRDDIKCQLPYCLTELYVDMFSLDCYRSRINAADRECMRRTLAVGDNARQSRYLELMSVYLTGILIRDILEKYRQGC